MTEPYDSLVKRGNVNGWYKRPASSDSYPPKAGTRVDWVLSQPVQDMLEQGRALGWANAGTIGNEAHLKMHGDHTGHSGGKVRGVIYAKDTALPKGGKDALLWLCKQPKYDTTWIQFFNVEGWQYDYAGNRGARSSDVHLHVSVKKGSELTRVGLFNDMQSVLLGTYGEPPAPAAFHRLGFIAETALVKTKADAKVYLAGRGKRTWIATPLELAGVQEYMQYRGMNSAIITVTALTGVEV